MLTPSLQQIVDFEQEAIVLVVTYLMIQQLIKQNGQNS